jgi:ribosomal protein S24E
MDITISKTNENPFLQRKEVHGEVSFTGATPSQKQLADALATKLGAKADAIFIVHVFTNFGSQKAKFEAHVYPSKEQLEKVVRLGIKAKEKAAGKAPAPGAAPAAAPAAPAPAPKAEEKKEAPKKEEPKKEEAKKEAPKPEAKKEEPKKAEVKA